MRFDQERWEGGCSRRKRRWNVDMEEEGLLCIIVSKLAQMLYFVCVED